jgi:hypothetical protein
MDVVQPGGKTKFLHRLDAAVYAQTIEVARVFVAPRLIPLLACGHVQRQNRVPVVGEGMCPVAESTVMLLSRCGAPDGEDWVLSLSR